MGAGTKGESKSHVVVGLLRDRCRHKTELKGPLTTSGCCTEVRKVFD